MIFDEVRACLVRDGWPVEQVSAETLRSRFRGKDRVFHMFPSVADAVASVSIELPQFEALTGPVEQQPAAA